MKNIVNALIISFLLLAGLQAASKASPSNSTFTSGGVPINVDVYNAVGTGTHPSIIFLYGSDGATLFPWNYPYMGSWFASQGYNFYMVHYFDRTGTVLGDPLTVYSSFNLWIQTVKDSTTWVAAQAGVNPQRIALMGMSLGAGLAVSTANQDTRIHGLAAWYGDIPSWYPGDTTITHMPPTIMIHGANDPIAPVSGAYAFQATLQQLGVPNQLVVYPNEGHALSSTDELDAMGKTVAFFQTYMNQ